jgi:hypothetical protein
MSQWMLVRGYILPGDEVAVLETRFGKAGMMPDII